jgi:type I restriction enzyme M protein
MEELRTKLLEQFEETNRLQEKIKKDLEGVL